ncbi:MAG: glycosyltransferase [Candidatus Brocadia sp. AMX2]|uniref:Glycosyltransferases n=1 Tax=Candidatus Brocadia sinica JPN1 TaxID=1197129 RepID=A0ABQ0K118_9BACT|nr:MULTISPECIES: glycosyltransferase [Brocadia]MBC6933281.1 glycosyltransferase [Candidatus Brocadia sp.]MBL1170158.1 glycosyltransferase [Candidatus Brocadia sp. AMX1]NOG42525.1 glycosyltransferase [Planctomycetota bacterium]GIK11755.1 MAG: glycosyl transferase family 2 [Candidatus Brocadia sinica]KAA0242170.1 MAG: glycosyltransferase [Candidatus Brocadia sp. AMX2]
MFDLILLCASVISAIIWLALLFMPVRWRMSERWEVSDSLHTTITQWPSLSVIVPARNESTSLPLTLPSWLGQGYPESEIILIDDESSDGTAACAKGISSQTGRNVKVICGTPPPTGWTGKLWALEQGVRASTGEWLLFTDADIFHSPGLWCGLVAKALNERRVMVSLMALLDTQGLWARLLIPAFVYFFHGMYPFKSVQNLLSKVSAAAGGCILISRQALDKIGGITGYSNALIDDIALARKIKDAEMPLCLSLTKSVVSVRPYRRLGDVWNMVARNAFAQLKYSWLALGGTVLGLVVLFLVPVAGICTFMAGTISQVTILSSGLSIFMMALMYVPTLRFFGLNVWRAFTLPIAGAFYLAMTVSSAINYLFGRHEWRGIRIKRD